MSVTATTKDTKGHEEQEESARPLAIWLLVSFVVDRLDAGSLVPTQIVRSPDDLAAIFVLQSITKAGCQFIGLAPWANKV